jgi:hypothetical protein
VTRRLSRRGFLALGLGVGTMAFGTIALRAVLSDRGVHVTADVRERLAAFLSDHEGAASLGVAALEVRPNRGELLAEQVAPPDVDAERWFAEVDAPRFAAHIRQRVREDFSAARTVVIDRWYLAQTEADVCALWALAR